MRVRSSKPSERTPKVLWHYTTQEKLAAILTTGRLRPTDVGVQGRERPAVWFSTRFDFEPTAAKTLVVSVGGVLTTRLATLDEMRRLVGVARIGVAPKTAPVDWAKHRREGRIAPSVADALEEAGRAIGSVPQDWFVSYEPVPAEEWILVQVLDDDGVWEHLS